MAVVRTRSIRVSSHGRYVVRVPEGVRPFPWIVGFHGYAENAEAHLAALERTAAVEDWLLISVQGLHRFYRGRSQEVVASWMTRQDRELAIDDNVAYLNAVCADVRTAYGAPTSVVYSGFSQGVAMAWRAAFRGDSRCDGLILLAGDVPPEIAARLPARLPRILLGRGRHDELYPPAQLEADVALLRRHGAEVEVCAFEGGHEWGDEFAQAAGRLLRRLVARPA